MDLVCSQLVPLPMNDLDAELILSTEFHHKENKQGLGEHLFAGHRCIDINFPLNLKKYQDARILAAGENFGRNDCTEHAAWALWDYGFRVIIAPSFDPVFFGNAVNNHLIPIQAEKELMKKLFTEERKTHPFQVTVDLNQQLLILPNGQRFPVKGMDDLDYLIHSFESLRQSKAEDYQYLSWEE